MRRLIFASVCVLTCFVHAVSTVWKPNPVVSSARFVTSTNSPLKTRLAGKRKPRGSPRSPMPSKSPSLAIAFPVLSTTTISSAWLAQTQMLSCSSITRPSAPLMELVNSSTVWPSGEIFTMVSFPVFATNKKPALSNARPFAPKGGLPGVVSSGLEANFVAGPPAGPVLQMIPWNESEM